MCVCGRLVLEDFQAWRRHSSSLVVGGLVGVGDGGAERGW